MDSFYLYFRVELSTELLAQELAIDGAQTYVRDSQELHISKGLAYLWINRYNKTQSAWDEFFEEEEKWPFAKELVATLVAVLVRRNKESDLLAIKVAHHLVQRFAGVIAWNGISYWERLYNDYFGTNSKAIEET